MVSDINGGEFTLLNGLITSWDLSGNTFLANCGAGPGCASDNTSASTSSNGDSLSIFEEFAGEVTFSNDSPGAWSPPIASSVPEPSTWAMMLIGFAGIGFLMHRKSVPRLRVKPFHGLNAATDIAASVAVAQLNP
jgi:hypothetical protein